MQLPKLSVPKLQPNQIALVLIGSLVLVVAVFAILYFRRTTTTGVPVALSVWGTDEPTAMSSVIGAYQALRPNVTVTYRKVDAATYEETVINALASGEGPDVFALSNRNVGTTLGKILPAPATTMSAAQVRALFPKAVEQDAIHEENVYGLPLYLDTLALYYNRDLLDAAGIVAPPTTWDDVQRAVPLLRTVNAQGQLEQAAIALGGTSTRIPYAADIVSMLLVQSGAPIVDAHHSGLTLGETGVPAFNFYIQFGNPSTAQYAWTDEFGSALQQFSDGKLAMMLGYASLRDDLHKQNPFAEYAIAPAPQTAGGTPRTYPRYQLFVVSKQSTNVGWAWDFVANIATQPAITQTYITATKRPPALRALIDTQVKDADLTTALFARQSLTARSWYQVDGAAVERSIDRAIRDTIAGGVTPERAARTVESALQQLYSTR